MPARGWRPAGASPDRWLKSRPLAAAPAFPEPEDDVSESDDSKTPPPATDAPAPATEGAHAETGATASGAEPEPGPPDEDARREELERLFEAWDARRGEEGGEPAGWQDDEALDAAGEVTWAGGRRGGAGLLWRTIFALVVTAVSVVLMMATRHEFTYWLHRGEPPIELGDLRQQWRDGVRELSVPSNSYVRAEGLYVTHEMAVIHDGEEPPSDPSAAGTTGEPSYKYFVEPLYRLVVRTPQELPDKPWHKQSVEVDSEWVWLVEKRLAFPQDLLMTMAIEGRLVRASEAPRWARRAVNTYALQTKVDPVDGWILLDGDKPETYGAAATLWFAAAGAPLIPIVLLALALLRRRRERAAQPREDES